MATLNDKFILLKGNLEPSETLSLMIQQRHNAVRSSLKNRNPNVVDTKLIGSVRRKTRIHPRTDDKFDIDILVIFGSFYSWLPPGSPGGVSPQQALDTLQQTVAQSDRYASMGPYQASPTIALPYADDITVEFVPAYIDQIGASPNGITHRPVGRAYWIPKNGVWELADYDYEASYISDQNEATDGWLIPTIKMIKAIKRIYFPTMKSFHLDIVAAQVVPALVAIRKQKRQAISYPDLIRDFFSYAPQFLSHPSKIPSSHSPEIPVVPTETATLVDAWGKIRQYIDTFNMLPEPRKIEGWKVLMGDPFPTS